MSLPSWNAQQIFDQLFIGSIWSTPQITYAFPMTGDQVRYGDKERPFFLPLNETQQDHARLALATWSDLIQRTIVPGEVGKSSIEFGNISETTSYAFAYEPPFGSIWFNAKEDVLLDPKVGSHGFLTFIHEIGHAIGMNHMGNYNGDEGEGPSSFEDSTVLTVMSYFGPEFDSGEGQVMWGHWLDDSGRSIGAQTPMLNDVMVIQALYGAATDTRADDTVYGFGSTATGPTSMLYDFTINAFPILTIYDSGGNDTLNLSGWSSDSLIDLRPGHFSNVNGMTNNLAIAYGVIIENAVGGAGNDILFGNAANNVLDGGGGIDRVIFTSEFSNYVIDFDLATSAYRVHDKTGREGTDILLNIERASFTDLESYLDELTSGVHRFYSERTHSHFYTASNDEAVELFSEGGFRYEGIGFTRSVDAHTGEVAVHRFLNETTGSHFYTADTAEMAAVLASGGFHYEGVAFNAFGEETDQTQAVHRFYNKDTGSHFYTASEHEADPLLVQQPGSFQYEGIAFYTAFA